MKVVVKLKKNPNLPLNVAGGCWAECCTYHYNTASNGSY